MEVLLSGLNTYLGRRAMGNLAQENFNVHGIVRDINLFNSTMIEKSTAVVEEVDLLRKGDKFEHFEIKNGLELAIFITHIPSLGEYVNLNLEIITLKNFIQLIRRNNCQRIIYIARLIDKPFIHHIEKVLESSGLTFTLVLKNLAIGKGSVLDKYMHQLINGKFLAYNKSFADIKFNPISALDLLRWIYNVDWNKNFKNALIEIGGPQTITIQEMFRLYKKTLYPQASVKSFKIPGLIIRLFFKNIYHIQKEDQGEFQRLMKKEYPIDNSTWKKIMVFSFTPLEQVIRIDQ